MTSPLTPCTSRLPASRSPTYPSSHGLVGGTTSRSPGRACSTATWIDQLSPGATSQVSALPATRAGRKMGRMSLRSSPVPPCASCTVATPASFRPSTIARSVLGGFRTTSVRCLLLSPRLVCHPPALLAALTEPITPNCRHDHTSVFYVPP